MLNGEAVRAAREQLGWSPERLADEVGCSVTTLNRWERGRQQPARVAVKALARTLGVDARGLVADAPEVVR